MKPVRMPGLISLSLAFLATACGTPSSTASPSPTIAITAPGTLTPAASLSPTMIPTTDGGGGLIVFYSERPSVGDWGVYIMHPDGSQLVRLAAGFSPAWSPDGQQVAFVDAGRIAVINADGSELRHLTGEPGEASDPDWSPDGQQIVFTSNASGNEEIYVINVDGSGQWRLTDDPALDFAPAWSPDGLWIAFSSDRDAVEGEFNTDLYLMGADGSIVRRLTDHPGYDRFPAWSPDGRQIAFSSDRDGDEEIYILDIEQFLLDGGGIAEVKRLTSTATDDRSPSFSPDGRKIIFQANYDIHMINTDGTGLTVLTDDFEGDYSPDWSAPIGRMPTTPRPAGPTRTPGPSATFTTTPSPTRTLGPPVTRTPAPAAQCPGPDGGIPPVITLESLYGSLLFGEEEDPLVGIPGYLNARGSADGLQAILSNLQGESTDPADFIKAQVITKDVTGDRTPDIILSLAIPTAPGGYGDAFLKVYICRDGLFRGHSIFGRAGAGSRAEGLYSGGGAQVSSVKDMNLDGVPEIVFVVRSLGELYVLEWDETGFSNLITYPSIECFEPSCLVHYIDVYNGDFVIEDRDGNGTLELTVSYGTFPTDSIFAEFGPARRRSEIWAWDGYLFNVAQTIYEPPQYRFQAVQDGDLVSREGDYAKALAFYQQAIFDEQLFGWSPGQLWPDSMYDGHPTPEPNPDERPRLSAYARYRILLLHVVQGYLSDAMVVYDTLQRMFPEGAVGHPYAELATVFWDEFKLDHDMAAACQVAIEFVATHASEILNPLGSAFYGYANPDYSPEDICLDS